MATNKRKFEALVQYVCWRCDDPRALGATKLNKILWYADALAFGELGAPITEAIYRKQQFGLVPDDIDRTTRELARRGAIAIRKGDLFGYRQRQYMGLKKPDISIFSSAEISIVDVVVEKLCDDKYISDAFHDRVWRAAQLGEEIPFYTVFSSQKAEITHEDVDWADAEIAKHEARKREPVQG